MIIKRNIIAEIYYQMKDEYGNIIDSNKEYSPLQYLHGYNNILPALEVELDGLSTNEEKYIRLNPEQAYGKYDTTLVFEIDKEQLGQDVELKYL
jgi:FKBP-type peptidyl-prolyl cis-trans isomerase SlyD